MICPYCNKEAIFWDNSMIYWRNYGKSYKCYLCKDCDAYVGVHQNDKNRPLGTMANSELREYRKKAHSILDPFWQVGRFTRWEMYRRLSKYFGKEIHIGESDIEMCKNIINYLEIELWEY